MYCLKCKHTSFDHLATCPKCGSDWHSIRTALNLNWLQSPGYEWLPEAALETAHEAEEQTALIEPEEPEESTLPSEPAGSEFAGEADEIFAFEAQGPDDPVSASASSPEDKLKTLLLQEKPEVKLEVPSGANSPDALRDTDVELKETPAEALNAPPLNADILSVGEPAMVASIIADGHDAAPLDHHEQDEFTVPAFSRSAEPTDGELPVWEVELPQDLLPHEFFPEPVGEERGSVERNGEHELDAVEIVGDITYDFSEVEVVLPELDEEAQPPASRDTASSSPSTADDDDAERPSVPLPSSDRKEGR